MQQDPGAAPWRPFENDPGLDSVGGGGDSAEAHRDPVQPAATQSAPVQSAGGGDGYRPTAAPFDRHVVLCVGGRRFEVLSSTLCEYPDTRLGRIAARGGEEQQEHVFDRSPGVFRHVLQWYRNHGKVQLPYSVTVEAFMAEAHFFELPVRPQEVHRTRPVEEALSAVSDVRDRIRQYQEQAKERLAQALALALFAAVLGDLIDAEEAHGSYQPNVLAGRWKRLVAAGHGKADPPATAEESEDEDSDDNVRPGGCAKVLAHPSFGALTQRLAQEQGLHFAVSERGRYMLHVAGSRACAGASPDTPLAPGADQCGRTAPAKPAAAAPH
eukprot:TRINITY_DN51643_c0_g1_i1.p1 TRINITY_DN51643_c0_g1~~TRINITY_DN51643_c0_g1_i1.p1  ORF type:complete len:349 (+),score=118.59 TRINITY_DN51643_c0_g1_i1:71-1048(+)